MVYKVYPSFYSKKCLLLSLFSALILPCTTHTTPKNGSILIEGKTKIVRSCSENNDLVILESKDTITAGDGLLRKDTIRGKSALSTNTTCNVFRLLAESGIPVAFCKQLDDTRFVAKKCSMILLEVVVRREAHGSALKRHPHLKKGQIFPQLIVEFFLKTTDRMWKGQSIPKDDPSMKIAPENAY